MYYAQIDPVTRICNAVTEREEIVSPYMIEVDGLHPHLLWKRHNEETGEFEAFEEPVANLGGGGGPIEPG